MAYDAADLKPNAPTDAAWALAWARKFSGDTDAIEVFSDDEWTAELEADKVTVTDDDDVETNYYRPHATAARVVEADPNWSSFEWLGDARMQARNPVALAGSIRRSGAWVDALIDKTIAARLDVAEVEWPDPPGTLSPGF